MPDIRRALKKSSGTGAPRAAWKPALVFLLSLTAFWPTLRTGFMIDDPFLLRAVQAEPGFTLKGLGSDLTHNVHNEENAFYYRPVLGMLTRAEFALWGDRPFGYHAVSLLFHAGGAVLLFYILSALELGPLLPFAAAALFAVNPVIIDDLLAATGGESMANFLLLASLLLFLKDRWVPALLLSFPALFAKESNIVLPALLALLLAYRGKLREELPKILSLLPGCLLYLLMREVYVGSPPGLEAGPLLKFAVIQLPGLLFHYLRVLLVPLGLETWPRIGAASGAWPLLLAAWLVGLGAAFYGMRKRPLAAFCAGWFVITMAPRVPAMLLNEVAMDKWVFLAGPAVYIAFLCPLLKLAERRSFLPRAAAAALPVLLAIFWASVAHANVSLRGSDEQNYRWTIRNGPRLFASYRLGLY
jgi:hypothetical protein